MELNTQVKAGIIGPNQNPADLPVNAHRRANARETSIRMSLKPLAKPPHSRRDPSPRPPAKLIAFPWRT
jgi:hypothetical protein